MPSRSIKRSRSRKRSRSIKRSIKKQKISPFSYGITIDVDYINNPALRPLKPHPDASKFFFERYEKDIEKWENYLDDHPNVKPIEPPDRYIKWLGKWFHDGGESEFSNNVPKNIIRTTQWYYGDKKNLDKMKQNFDKYYSDLKKDGRVKKYKIKVNKKLEEEDEY